MDTKMEKTLKNAKKWLKNKFYENMNGLIDGYLKEEENEHIIKVEFVNGYSKAFIVDTIEKIAYSYEEFFDHVIMTDLVYIQEKIFPELEKI